MSTENARNIYDFVTHAQEDYENPKGIEVEEGWNWSMKAHLKQSFLYLNSQFLENNSDRTERPFKNIVLPILNIQFRTEDFDVKDIELYVDNPDEYHKSLLIKKYHDNWALENEIDTYIDEMVVSYCTYGGILARKRLDKVRPDVVDLRTLAFCNQTDILAYPFGIKHEFSPAELREASDLWGDGDKGATMDIETLITKAKKEGDKTIEVFEIHGNMPIEWMQGRDLEEWDDSKDIPQVQIISYYMDENSDKQGVTLFKSKEPKLNFKFLARDPIEGRALGRGGVEEIFQPQEWTNWDEIKITEMLAGAAKTLYASDDIQFKSRNNLNNVKNNQVFTLQEGKRIDQINTFPQNLGAFNDSVVRFWNHAQLVGGAPDPLVSETPSSGTPFKLYEAQLIEGKGMHKYRQDKLAVFMDEIYRDWILPHLAKEVSKEQIFMQELSVDEIQTVAEKIVIKKANQFKIKMILTGQEVNEDLVEDIRQKVKEEIAKKGTKWFFKILKDEMKDAPFKVMTNIAGKQKNLALMTDKVVNVLRQLIATPQIRQDKGAMKALNEILEFSGMSPMMFDAVPPPQIQPSASTQPLKEIGQQAKE